MARKRPTSNGKCDLCGAVFSKSAMTTHLRSCKKKARASEAPQKAAKRRAFHLIVEGRDLPEYWMHLEVPAEAMLGSLDRFLRDTWLECCGHMSEFEIEGTRYPNEPMDVDDESMDARLKEVLTPGMKFDYVYDFGSSTYLRLKVVSEDASDLKRNEIRVLARNEPPVIPCGNCGKPATQVCQECAYSEEGWLCAECAAKHDCDEWMLLPVVNSPRVGVCGYAG